MRKLGPDDSWCPYCGATFYKRKLNHCNNCGGLLKRQKPDAYQQYLDRRKRQVGKVGG